MSTLVRSIVSIALIVCLVGWTIFYFQTAWEIGFDLGFGINQHFALLLFWTIPFGVGAIVCRNIRPEWMRK